MKKYDKELKETSNVPSVTPSLLDELIKEGARRMIAQALLEEVEDVRVSHPAKPYRNGYGKERQITTPVGSLPLTAPRLRISFESKILKRYQRTSSQFDELLPQLYLHGLSTNDFEACFRAILGAQAPLSASSIARMKSQWQQEYQNWLGQPLEEEYLYVWVDAIYPKAGAMDEPLCVLVAVGLNRRGEKKILALHEGYRESYESWKRLFHQLKKRGVTWIGLLIADGIQSVWKAAREVFPLTRRQRCWVHKFRNILDHIPDKMHDEVLEALRAMYHATSKEQADRLVKTFVAKYSTRYPKAVASLEEALPNLFTYLQFPKEHWRSIKTTNPIESIFSPVRKRLKAAGRIALRQSALLLVFQLLNHQQTRLRKINKHKLVAQTIDQLRKTKKSKYRVAA